MSLDLLLFVQKLVILWRLRLYTAACSFFEMASPWKQSERDRHFWTWVLNQVETAVSEVRLNEEHVLIWRHQQPFQLTDFATCSEGIQFFEVEEYTWKFGIPQNICIVKFSMSLCTFQPCSFWFHCMYGTLRSPFLYRNFWTHLWTLYLHQPTTLLGTQKFQS